MDTSVSGGSRFRRLEGLRGGLAAWLAIALIGMRPATAGEPIRFSPCDPPRDSRDQPWRVASLLDDGLSAGTFVDDLAFESDGTAWLATERGVVRYDGWSWERFGLDEGLPSERVRCIAVLPDGQVWAGTEGGLVHWDPGGNRFRPAEALKGYPLPRLRRIVPESGGAVWLCGDRPPQFGVSAALFLCEPGREVRGFGEPEGLPSLGVLDVFRDASDRIFAMTNAGLSVREGEGWRDVLTRVPGWKRQSIWSMAQDRDGTLFAFGESAIFIEERGSWRRFEPRYWHPRRACSVEGRVVALAADPQSRRIAFVAWNGQDFAVAAAPVGVPPHHTWCEGLRRAPDGSVWAVGHGMLWRWERRGEWSEFGLLPEPAIRDGRGRVWFRSREETVRVDPRGRWDSAPVGLRRGQIDAKDRVWDVSAEGGEVRCWDDEGIRTFDASATGVAHPRGLVFDRRSTPWLVGDSADGGQAVAFHDGERWVLRHRRPPGPERIVRICRGDEGPWMLVLDREVGSYRLLNVGRVGPPIEIALDPAIRPADPGVEPPPRLDAQDRLSAIPGLLDCAVEGVWLFGERGVFQRKGMAPWVDHELIPPSAHIALGVSGRAGVWLLAEAARNDSSSIALWNGGAWQSRELEEFPGLIHGEDPGGGLYLADRDRVLVFSGDLGAPPREVTIPGRPQITAVVPGPDGETVWMGTDRGTLRFEGDRIPPRTRILGASSTLTRGESLVANCRAVERFRPASDERIFRYEWRFDDGDWRWAATFPLQLPTAPLELGEHVLEVRAIDEGGDREETPARHHFRVDGLPFQQRAGFLPAVFAALAGTLGIAALAWIARGKMASQARTLESAVRMRTTELQAAKEQAESASRAKSEFVAQVSHELRNPLGSILGLTDLTLEGELSEPVRRDLLLSRDCAEHLLDLINGLLDVAKIEAGKFEAERGAFDLEPWLAGLLKVQAYHARNKGLELSCRVAPEVPRRVVGDAPRLRQVLINLVGNAIKFTDKGEIEVGVEYVEAMGRDEVILRFTVRDTGAGIPQAQRQEIFLPFRQGPATVARLRGGAGLGLSIASKLVTLMSGALELESAIGSGSTFRFTARLGVIPPVTSHVDPFWPGRRALVVGPNPMSRSHWSEHLRRRGLLTTGVGSQAEAIDLTAEVDTLFQVLPYDVVILDCDADGPPGDVEALELALPGVPIVRVGSLGCSDATRPEGEGEGRIIVLTKPVLPGEIDEALAEAFGSSAEAGAPARAAERNWPAGDPDEEAAVATTARILVADDDPVNRFMFERLLRGHGYEPMVVSDGRQALRALEEQSPFDLVVLDGGMPGLNGTDVIARWRARELAVAEGGACGHLPALAVTAAAMQGDRELILAAGFDAYCPKPVRPREFLAAIASLLSGSPAKGGAGHAGPVAAKAQAQAADLEGYRCAAELFLEHTLLRWDRIREALRDGDLEATRAIAHQIRGTLAYFAPEEAVAALGELEAALGRGDLAEVRGCFERLSPEFEEMLGKIREEVVPRA